MSLSIRKSVISISILLEISIWLHAVKLSCVPKASVFRKMVFAESICRFVLLFSGFIATKAPFAAGWVAAWLGCMPGIFYTAVYLLFLLIFLYYH